MCPTQMVVVFCLIQVYLAAGSGGVLLGWGFMSRYWVQGLVPVVTYRSAIGRTAWPRIRWLVRRSFSADAVVSGKNGIMQTIRHVGAKGSRSVSLRIEIVLRLEAKAHFHFLRCNYSQSSLGSGPITQGWVRRNFFGRVSILPTAGGFSGRSENVHFLRNEMHLRRYPHFRPKPQRPRKTTSSPANVS